MVYRVIGLMSGSALDGLDIAFVEFQEGSAKWSYQVRHTACYAYSGEWKEKLRKATSLSAVDYQLLHAAYGHYLGEQVNKFISEFNVQYQVQLIASHGHATFHLPDQKMTAQLGDGAAIAAETGINVVSDLRAMDVALGGKGAPIVPIGEKLLLGDHPYFLNLGGIANISYQNASNRVAFDVCPANRVLNMVVKDAGKPFDDGGQLSEKGDLNEGLLKMLNNHEYYTLPYPKALANDFGTDVIFPLIDQRSYDMDDALRTYVEHIAIQVARAVAEIQANEAHGEKKDSPDTMLVTGGGAKNTFLIKRIERLLEPLNVKIVIAEPELVDFKEAIIMGLIGLLRWREENNVLASVTGASRDSIGGAVWIGLEA